MAGPTQRHREEARGPSRGVRAVHIGLAISANSQRYGRLRRRAKAAAWAARTPTPQGNTRTGRTRRTRAEDASGREGRGAKKFAPPTPNPTRLAAPVFRVAQPAASKPPSLQPAIAQPQPAEEPNSSLLTTPAGSSGDMYTFSALAEPVADGPNYRHGVKRLQPAVDHHTDVARAGRPWSRRR